MPKNRSTLLISDDLTDKTFGKLTVLGEFRRDDEPYRSRWLCKCSCGKTITPRTHRLILDKIESCGCGSYDTWLKKSDVTGKKFGKLTVTSRSHRDTKNRRWFWNCRCDCGSDCVVATKNLQRNPDIDCGCGHFERQSSASRLPDNQSLFNAIYLRFKSNAKRKERVFELTREQIRDIVTGPCHYCGVLPSHEFKKAKLYGSISVNSIDRVDSLKGYTIDNVVSCCMTCNTMKWHLPYDVFLAKIKAICIHLD